MCDLNLVVRIYETKLRTHLQNNQLVFFQKKKKKIKMKKQKRLRDIKDNIGSTDNTRISIVDQTIILN